jgi:histidine kinase
MRRTLRGRLLAMYGAVIVAVVAVAFIAVRLLTPTLFEQRLRAGLGSGGAGRGQGGPPASATVTTDVQDAYDSALTVALVVSAIVGLVVALLLVRWLTRRLLRHLGEMQTATRRLSEGEYRRPVPVPAEAELADLATSINALGASLAATEQSRAKLVSDLAHELRNPLATIEGFMEGLIDGVLPPTTETYSTVAAETHRLRRLTEDLSLLSRAQEDALELNIVDSDLGDVVRTVSDRLGPQYDVKGVDLRVDVPGSLPVRADVDRMVQALTNLVGNALTHTPRGGSVTVAGARSRGSCRITVTDTGAGISPAELETIFERFTRLDPDSGGTGLGLHIARTIARLHGGDIAATSAGPGTGATFTLTLPAGGS